MDMFYHLLLTLLPPADKPRTMWLFGGPAPNPPPLYPFSFMPYQSVPYFDYYYYCYYYYYYYYMSHSDLVVFVYS